MRLYLAVAVLMMVFIAYTEAQESDFDKVLAKIKEGGQQFAEKIQTHFETVRDSNVGENIKNWWDSVVTKLTPGNSK